MHTPHSETHNHKKEQTETPLPPAPADPLVTSERNTHFYTRVVLENHWRSPRARGSKVWERTREKKAVKDEQRNIASRGAREGRTGERQRTHALALARVH